MEIINSLMHKLCVMPSPLKLGVKNKSTFWRTMFILVFLLGFPGENEMSFFVGM